MFTSHSRMLQGFDDILMKDTQYYHQVAKAAQIQFWQRLHGYWGIYCG